jgi:hypothetical protein
MEYMPKARTHNKNFLTAKQEALLERFADISDKLFEFGVITTDSFIGGIGEFKEFIPIKVISIPSKDIANGEIRITSSNLVDFKTFKIDRIKIPLRIKSGLIDFAQVYNELQKSGIARSKRIVGDIGEFYAARQMNLQLVENLTNKGIDAVNDSGLTFEIKTRRVYESGRRNSRTRRFNNLIGKSADYLIVVTLNRSFKCSGMWIMPMSSIANPKSAKLKIVNFTPGVRNIVSSVSRRQQTVKRKL